MAYIAAVQDVFADASSQIALITMAGVVPQFFLYPLIGSVVDNVDRRRLLWAVFALKTPLVLLFIFQLANYDAPESDFRTYWYILLAAVFILSVITVPFSPARASAIPDVVSESQQGISASLIATTGLVSILGGSTLGGYLATLKHVGPAKIIPMAAALFAIAIVCFRALPATVSRRNTQRKKEKEEKDVPAGASKTAGMLRDTWEGMKYSLQHKAVLALIVFESIFWICAIAFYLLNEWHAASKLYLVGDYKILHYSLGLGCAGVGLFVGALTVGKFCRQLSPLLTYMPSFLLIGWSMKVILGTEGSPVMAPCWEIWQQADPPNLLEARAVLPALQQQWFTLMPQNVELARSLLPWFFLLGLGGGGLLGRIDADMLAIIEERVRGRIFALKGFFFTAALMGPLVLFAVERSHDVRESVSSLLPTILMASAILAFLLSWIIDCAIFAKKSGLEPPGLTERIAYGFGRLSSWLIAKLYFRYSVVNADKFPKTGPVLVVANHGSFFDPFWLGISTNRIVRYIMHSSYYRGIGHPFFRALATIPVDEAGALAALRAGKKVLEDGGVVGMFPEGHVSDDGQLQQPKGGAMFLAQRGGAQVVPVALKGNTTAFPRWYSIPRPFKITAIITDPFTIPKDASREEVAAAADRAMAQIGEALGLPAPPKAKVERRRKRDDSN
jgi:1-acyl-sn-glycerol-3-phosphate acyltransferase